MQLLWHSLKLYEHNELNIVLFIPQSFLLVINLQANPLPSSTANPNDSGMSDANHPANLAELHRRIENQIRTGTVGKGKAMDREEAKHKALQESTAVVEITNCDPIHLRTAL